MNREISVLSMKKVALMFLGALLESSLFAASTTVRFVMNGGAPAMANVSVSTQRKTYVLPVCAARRTGYLFAGWTYQYPCGECRSLLRAGDVIELESDCFDCSDPVCSEARREGYTVTAQWVSERSSKGRPQRGSANDDYIWVGRKWVFSSAELRRQGNYYPVLIDDGSSEFYEPRYSLYRVNYTDHGGFELPDEVYFDDYEFLGWDVYDACMSSAISDFSYSYGSRYIGGYLGRFPPGYRYPICGDTAIVAVYRNKVQPQRYTVRLHRNNSVNDGATAVRTHDMGVITELPTVDALGWTRSGYDFAGWGTYQSDTSANYSNGGYVRDLAAMGETVHLYAIWRSTAKTYTVRLHRNNSANDGATAGRALTVGKSRALPTIASLGWTRSGYEFVGWGTYQSDTSRDYTDGQSIRDLSTTQSATVHLYAIWRSTAKTYTVRLHRNNSANDGATAGRTLTVGKTRALPTIASLGWTRSGYEFVGWGTCQSDTSRVYADGQSVRDLSTTQSATIHLYAIWRSTAAKYVLRLHRNNDSEDGATAGRSLTVGVARQLPTVAEMGWRNECFTFVGWSSSSNATYPDYKDGDSVINLSYRDGAEVHLYGVWRIARGDYVVRFHRNDGVNGMQTASKAYYLYSGGWLPTARELGWSSSGILAGWARSRSTPWYNVSYDEGAYIYNLTYDYGKVVHLYAIWY